MFIYDKIITRNTTIKEAIYKKMITRNITIKDCTKNVDHGQWDYKGLRSVSFIPCKHSIPKIKRLISNLAYEII